MLHINMVIGKLNREIALVRRHIGILRILEDRGPLGILKLSHITRMNPAHVRYSLRVLQQSSFLEPTAKGAKINRKALSFIKNLKNEKTKLIALLNKI